MSCSSKYAGADRVFRSGPRPTPLAFAREQGLVSALHNGALRILGADTGGEQARPRTTAESNASNAFPGDSGQARSRLADRIRRRAPRRPRKVSCQKRVAPFARAVGVVRAQRSTPTIDAHRGAATWEALYDAHASDIAKYLRRLVGDLDTAADLMQETYVRAMRAERQPPVAEMRPWLYRIASNLAMSHLRRPRLGRLSGLGRHATLDPSTEDSEHVRQAMRSIPPEQAVTLALAFHEGFARREIAEMLGVSDEAVKSRIARGRLNFTAAYKRLERGLRA